MNLRYRARWMALLLLWPLIAAGNALKGYPSPYLAMHGEDQIEWLPFGEDALRKARETGRMIFLSSGYFACHWCHVMHRESFRDAEVAKVLDANFVSVKIDRELSPALDATLMDFVERTRGQGGWPLQVILTPEGEPLIGFTYLPRDRLLDVLRRLAGEWRRRPEELRRLAHAQVAELQPGIHPADRLPEAKRLRARLLEEAGRLADDFAGGFGHQSRFPMAPQLEVLLRVLRDAPPEQHGTHRKHLALTLSQMSGLGLRDHVNGGFFRYTVDPEWRHPHFEKMLYDNAQLAALYLRAGRAWKQPGWRAVGRETLDFLLERMAHPEGGFVASLSAVDETGREGGCYLWTKAELETVLGKKGMAEARRLFRLADADRIEGQWLIVPMGAGAYSDDARQREALLERLRQARADCRMPVDGKRLAGWNALALEALCEGAREPAGEGGARYRQAAQAQFEFMRRHFVLPDGRLARARSGLRVLAAGDLEDYGLFARALTRCGAVLPEAGRLAVALVEQGLAQFLADDGWRNPVRRLLPWVPDRPALADESVPSVSAALIEAAQATGAEVPVEKALRLAAPVVEEAPFWYASHVPLFGE